MMAKNRTNSRIKGTSLETVDSGKEIPHPKLIWTYFKYDTSEANECDRYKELDSDQFTNAAIINDNFENFNKYQKEYEKNLGCKEFWMKFRISKNIFFIDNFINRFYINRIFDEIKKINSKNDYVHKSISIFAEWGREDYTNTKQLIKNNEKKLKAPIDIYNLEHNVIHDRFALMDGEIWHCGAAVGGMHGRLSALSRGWEDRGDKMLKYIINLQKEAGRRQW